MRRFLSQLILAMLSIAVLATLSPAQAQFGKLKDKVKKKTTEKVDKKVDDKIDKTLDGALDGSKTPAEGQEGAEKAGEAPAEEAAGGAAAPAGMALYTKYDFVPGDKVIFYDDLSGEEMGEFPSRWKLDQGVFEITKLGDRKWIMCSDDGYIRPKVAPAPLPPKYTVEWDFLPKKVEAWGHRYCIQWLDDKDGVIGEFFIGNNRDTGVRIMGKPLADKGLEVAASTPHTMRVMATKTTLKCYIDNERVGNIPAVDDFKPVALRVQVWPGHHNAENPMLLGTFRYAEGGKTMKEQLDEAGRIVTHGILFDSGSDKIKPESYKTLADIGAMLTDNPTLRLSIEGHTDSDGATEANQALSEKRAAAARTYLAETYKVDGNRLESKGLGESTPIDTNDTPEGKANNRRVELVKL